MYRTVLIEPLIETLQDMDYTDSQKDIRSIDKSIADYSAKQTVLSKLYSSGALGTDEWNIKKSEVEFELNKLRKVRKKHILCSLKRFWIQMKRNICLRRGFRVFCLK